MFNQSLENKGKFPRVQEIMGGVQGKYAKPRI
jgi:hypothetical protein